MTDELFTIPESKSPRLVWMEANGVTTEYCPELLEWCAGDRSLSAFGYGNTELDAVTELAIKLNLKLWNEQ